MLACWDVLIDVFHPPTYRLESFQAHLHVQVYLERLEGDLELSTSYTYECFEELDDIACCAVCFLVPV